MGTGDGIEGIDGCCAEGWVQVGFAGIDGGRLTTQTPGMAYLPSAAFRSMTLALFWERSTLGFCSAMLALEEGG